MAYLLTDLLENSKLPGPRANLELLYTFTTSASEKEIVDCLNIQQVSLNTPEEFALTCGVAASIYHSAATLGRVDPDYIKYANHESWRVREGICIGFQKSKNLLTSMQMLEDLQILSRGTALEMRTYIATLSEPCLLMDYIDPNWLLNELYRITSEQFQNKDKIDDELKVLRKALGYCWSVPLCGDGADKTHFEKLLELRNNKHIQWIIKENLKKKRLEKLDNDWVCSMLKSIE